MDYSLNHLISYVKANWKHLLAGFVAASAANHFGAPGSAKAQAILKIIGLG